MKFRVINFFSKVTSGSHGNIIKFGLRMLKATIYLWVVLRQFHDFLALHSVYE